MKFLSRLNRLTPNQILMLAGIFGILIFALIYSTFNKIENEKEQEVETKIVEVTIPQVDVIVATMDIPAHAMVSSRMIEVESMPENLVPRGAITEIRKIIGHPTTVEIFAGDVFTTRKVFEDISQAGFIGDIPPDCRAISVPINDVSAVSGFIEPGDFVDILIVSNSDDSISSKILLQNVLLLAIGSTSENRKVRSSTDAEGNEVSNNQTAAGNSGAATATLALHPSEILQLTANMETGNINLILRPFKPASEIIEETEYKIQKRDDDDQPRNNPQPVNNPTPIIQNELPIYQPDIYNQPAQIKQPKKHTIEVIRGTSASEEHG